MDRSLFVPESDRPVRIEMNFDNHTEDWGEYVHRFAFDLPESLIARYPAQKRDLARMLVIHRGSGRMEDLLVSNLPRFLGRDDLLVRNVTRVSPRRVNLVRNSGGRIEALFLSSRGENGEDCSTWIALLRGVSRLTKGEILYLYGEEIVTVFRFDGRYGEKESLITALNFSNPGHPSHAWSNPLQAESFFEQYGMMPIPPYLGRKADHTDKERYQTVYARGGKSVAAPTAGLHFTEDLITELHHKGVALCDLELIIGYGTFAPLTEQNFRSKRLHSETYRIDSQTAQALNEKKGRIISVGTTTLRALESEFRKRKGIYHETEDSTDLFIHPPDRVSSIDGLMTNFHLPESSLLMLVAAFAGEDLIMRAYDHAVRNSYRFYSYGDTMLIL